jgi:hypothetical protein
MRVRNRNNDRWDDAMREVRREYGVYWVLLYICIGVAMIVLLNSRLSRSFEDVVFCGGVGAMLTAWMFLRRQVKRKLTAERQNLCPKCGYDLRASLERCPECGAISPRAEIKFY